MDTALYISSKAITTLNCLLYFVKNFWNKDPNKLQQTVPKKPTKARNSEYKIKLELEWLNGMTNVEIAVIPYKITLGFMNCKIIPV